MITVKVTTLLFSSKLNNILTGKLYYERALFDITYTHFKYLLKSKCLRCNFQCNSSSNSDPQVFTRTLCPFGVGAYRLLVPISGP